MNTGGSTPFLTGSPSQAQRVFSLPRSLHSFPSSGEWCFPGTEHLSGSSVLSLYLCASVVERKIHLNHRGTEAQRGKGGRTKSSSMTFPSASLGEEFLRSGMQNTPRFWVRCSGIDRDRYVPREPTAERQWRLGQPRRLPCCSGEWCVPGKEHLSGSSVLSLCLCASVVERKIHLNHRGTEVQRGKGNGIGFIDVRFCLCVSVVQMK